MRSIGQQHVTEFVSDRDGQQIGQRGRELQRRPLDPPPEYVRHVPTPSAIGIREAQNRFWNRAVYRLPGHQGYDSRASTRLRYLGDPRDFDAHQVTQPGDLRLRPAGDIRRDAGVVLKQDEHGGLEGLSATARGPAQGRNRYESGEECRMLSPHVAPSRGANPRVGEGGGIRKNQLSRRSGLQWASLKTVTALLVDWRDGDEAAMQRLLPLVHDELRRIAKRHMAGERPDHVLQATALVNEAYLRLVDVRRVQWQDRAHFFAIWRLA